MRQRFAHSDYFPFHIQISAACGDRVDHLSLLKGLDGAPGIIYARRLAAKLNLQVAAPEKRVQPGLLHLYSILNRVFRYLVADYCGRQQPGILARVMADAGYPAFSGEAGEAVSRFMTLYPSRRMVLGEETPEQYLAEDDADQGRREALSAEMFLLMLSVENPALTPFRQLFDDRQLKDSSPYLAVISRLERLLAKAPPFQPLGYSLPELLRAPVKASPDSLSGQIAFIREKWGAILPNELVGELVTALDIVSQEGRSFSQGGGGTVDAQVLKFGKGIDQSAGDYPEYERFSRDADWMSNVVMIAKMVYVWLGQLSKTYGTEVRTLDQIPDAELDRLSRYGFTALWLIGIWERSPASQKIKQITGNYDAISSAYSLYDYVIAADLGGEWALDNLRLRCTQRGIRLASDMVPNHTGLYSKWTLEHPDWFVQLDYPPYPDYQFTGADLSSDGRIGLYVEDGYWDRTDAAVVFKHVERSNGRVRYIYHGNDGTSTPWNDTAQLNYLIPEVREAVMGTILHVARQFPIIRFDAAMTLAKKHYQRLWYPLPGHGGGVPSRAEYGMERARFDEVFPNEFWREVVDRVAQEAPDTLLLAEAFWLMEGYFVRTLGMHRVYNSAFMNMLKMEENAKYRQTLKNVLEFEPEILKRFVNFMNNPDERTAVEQFGKEGKYFGATVLLVTMPGLPMIGHGQIEGFHEKYGMEYRRAYWDEQPDQHFVERHESDIFPLMRRRHIFSGSDQFTLYDFYCGSAVDENVFAYSNRVGDERGVIFFHNCFASTAGWIRMSCGMLRKEAGGNRLVQKSLGEALEFKGDGRHYYSFRDYATGLSYLRNGRELCEQGLYVQMHAYEYHAFLDFEEIWDDDYGTWGALCQRLNGAGVPSLAEELKQVRFAAVNDALRAVLAKAAALCEDEDLAEQQVAAQLTPPLLSFWQALGEHGGAKQLALLPAAFAADLERLLQAGAIDPAGDPSRWLLLCLLLALHRVQPLEEEGAHPLLALGLGRPVAEAFAALPAAAADQVVPLWPKQWAELLQVLIVCAPFVEKCRTSGLAAAVGKLVAEPAAAHFLLVHESGGVSWFNKERWELLLDGFSLLSLLRQPAPAVPAELAGVEHSNVEALCADLAEAAEAAGYRLDLFLELVARRTAS